MLFLNVAHVVKSSSRASEKLSVSWSGQSEHVGDSDGDRIIVLVSQKPLPELWRIGQTP